MRLSSFMIASAVLVVGGRAYGNDAMVELASKSGCFICHRLEEVSGTKAKPLAPSYAAVARRYAKDPDAEQKLVPRVLHGSIGKAQRWRKQTSMQFMPPNVNIDEATATKLVRWIISLEREVPARLIKHDEMLAKAYYSGCMACHAVESLKDGRYVPLAPAFREIAGRFKGQKNALLELTRSVTQGTLGRESRWKNVNMQFMPASVNLNDAQAKELVSWILELEAR